jgi:hypothetical protein
MQASAERPGSLFGQMGEVHGNRRGLPASDHRSELQEDCVDQLPKVSDWLRRLERVELTAQNPKRSAAHRLIEWLNADTFSPAALEVDRFEWRPRGTAGFP